MMGMHGEAWVNRAIQDADLIIAVGMRFDDRVTGNLARAPSARARSTSSSTRRDQQERRVDVPIVGDVRRTCWRR
jgi:acetolactate synthase-1/2/3 large subunit